MWKNHAKIEKNSIILLILIIIVVSIGGMVEILPLFRIETTIEKVDGVRPYTPLELAGYKIYIREGCYTCHSQQIRPLRDEVERYGHYSLAAESMYDFPFQWGSKRTGPDLARLGGKYSDEWHKIHLINPRDVVPESVMPGYPFLMKREADILNIAYDMKTLAMLGVPYSDEMISHAYGDAVAQANPEFESAGFEKRYSKLNIRSFDGNPEFISEMDALIAYLQQLGIHVDFKDYDPTLRTNKHKINE
jgi:cytochrome c oxidase cbb3-type subunit II